MMSGPSRSGDKNALEKISDTDFKSQENVKSLYKIVQSAANEQTEENHWNWRKYSLSEYFIFTNFDLFFFFKAREQ